MNTKGNTMEEKFNKIARIKLKELIAKHEDSLAAFSRKHGYNYNSTVSAMSGNENRYGFRLDRMLRHIEEYGVKVELNFEEQL